MNLKTVKTLAASAVVAASAAVANATTASGYVQDGLVAMWDGYENNGAGGHATELTEWKDLSGTYSFVFNANSGITVNGNALVFPGTQAGYATLNAADTDATFDICSNGVLEVVAKAENGDTMNVLLQSSSASGIAFGATSKSGDNVRLIAGIAANSQIYYYDWTSAANTFSIDYNHGKSVAMHVDGCKKESSATALTAFHSPKDATYLGHRAALNNGQAFKGTVYAIRLYSKPLTREQRAQNALIDSMRFGIDDVYPLSGLYVRGEPQNYGEGTPEYGFAEKSVGDDVTMSAPAFVALQNEARAYCTGWKLYDRVTGTLLGESTDETRLTCAFTYEKPVRLDWQWEVRYPVIVSAAAGLTVTPESGWGSAMTPAEFTVVGADFPLWLGEGLIGNSHAKTAAFAPTAATSVTVAKAVVREPTDLAGLKAEIASAGDGDVIIVPDGTMSFADVTAVEMAADLLVVKDILLTSRSGNPEDVTIDLGGTGNGFTLNAAGARLRGVTFTSSADMNDSTDSALPRFVNVVAGVLDACVFTNIVIGGSKVGSYPVALAAEGIIENCRFDDVSCKMNYMEKGTVYGTGGLIRDTVFRSCNTRPAPIYGTGDASIVVEGCSFTGINASSTARDALYGAFSGKGLSLARPTVIARRTLVANNVLPGKAGVAQFTVGNKGGQMKFEDCVLTNNVAGGSSCGVFRSDGGSFVCDRCLISDNVGDTCGLINSAAYNSQIFRNCMIRGNTGKTSAGVVAASGQTISFQFENCTVTGNKTISGTVHGIAIAGCGNNDYRAWVKNCIVYGNGPSATDTQLTVDADKVFFSCYPEADDGVNGNISADPQLQADGMLKYTSPCLDGGDNLTLTAGTVDIAGVTRPQNARGAAVSLWDMGCFEMPPNSASLEVTVVIDRMTGTSPAMVVATAQTSGTDLSGLVYDWMVTRTTPSGSTVTEYKGRTEPELALTDLAPGSYSFAVKVTNGSGDEATTTCENTFSAKTPVCYVSKTGSATWPYDTPEKATLVLADAIANAAERVEIDAGEYTAAEMGTMKDLAGDDYVGVLDRALVISGKGTDRTVIDANGIPCFSLRNADASVCGLAITNMAPKPTLFEGLAFRITAGVVSNVVVDSGRYFGSAVYVGRSGLFSDSTIKNLKMSGPYDSAYPIGLAAGTVRDVVISDNEGKECGGLRMLRPSNTSMRGTLVRVKVRKNKVSAGVGALAVEYPVDAYECEFCDNESAGSSSRMDGATVSIFGGGATDVNPVATLTGCKIVGNKVSYGRAVLKIANYANGSLTNVLVAGNEVATSKSEVSSLGSVAVDGLSDGRFTNVTVADNDVRSSVNGGIYVGRHASNVSYRPKYLVNCVTWGNRGTRGDGSANLLVGDGVSPVTIGYCCWPEAAAVDGCTNENPKLRTVRRYAYYPSPHGSCYETGDASFWTDDDVDLAGKPRRRKGKVDMGCYQAVPLPGLMMMLK